MCWHGLVGIGKRLLPTKFFSIEPKAEPHTARAEKPDDPRGAITVAPTTSGIPAQKSHKYNSAPQSSLRRRRAKRDVEAPLVLPAIAVPAPAPTPAPAPVHNPVSVPGIPNTGNSCYLNAGLSFLIHTMGGVAGLEKHLDDRIEKLKTNADRDPDVDFKLTIARCMRAMLKAMQEPMPDPDRLALHSTTLQGLMQERFAVGLQQDATEWVEEICSVLDISPDTTGVAMGLQVSTSVAAAINPDTHAFEILPDCKLDVGSAHLSRVSVPVIPFDPEDDQLFAPDMSAPVLLPRVVNRDGVETREEMRLMPVELIVHMGTDQAGHYVSCHLGQDGKWRIHNDDAVVEFSPMFDSDMRPVMVTFQVL